MSPTNFSIFPAIDLRKGAVVRLLQGNPDHETRYYTDPIDAAKNWIDEGAEWLHIVNLDGAFGEQSKNNMVALERILNIVASLNQQVRIQFGGGIKNLELARELISKGVERVIFGSAAVNNPEMISQAVTELRDNRILIAVDTRDNKVSVHGWQKGSMIDPVTLGVQLYKQGIRNTAYTNILKDGSGKGIDITGTARFKKKTGLNVIASGGLSSLDEIKEIRAAGLDGVIIGRALYDDKFRLKDALEC